MTVFEAKNYKDYLKHWLDSKERGKRAQLSRYIRCQTAYTAQVLNGAAHFSLEQADLINEFLGHGEEEASCFLNLVQRDRAGTPRLRSYFERQLKAIYKARLNLKNRIGASSTLEKKVEAQFYSAWYYAAIHALVSIPKFSNTKNVDVISRTLHLEIDVVHRAITFLLESGLLEQSKNRFIIGNRSTHLGSDSLLIRQHHLNWRLRAMESMDRKHIEDLHYSAVFSLSESDSERLREILVEFIRTTGHTVQGSNEETLRCLTLDFFKPY